MKKNLLPLILLSVISLLIILPSCTSEEEKQRITKAEKEELRKEDSLALKIGVLPTEDCDAILLADSLGLYEKAGVTVHIRRYGSLSECRYALRKHLVEGAAIDSVLAEIIKSKDSTSLTTGQRTTLSWKLVTAKKSRVIRLEQLADKIVAADSHGGSKILAQQVADSLGKKRLFIVQCEDVKVRYDMLISGNVDGAMLPEPYASMAVAKGANILKEYPKYNTGVIAFRTKALKDKRIKKQYERFLEAYKMACDSINVRKNKKK